MKIKLSELKQIIREEVNKGPHAAEKQLEAQKAQRGAAKKQMKGQMENMKQTTLESMLIIKIRIWKHTM